MKFHLTENDVWQLLEQVKDPEVPVLSIIDLGIVRAVETKEDCFLIKITPTYTGCPAMDMIAADIKILFEKNNIPCKVELVLSPAWTTKWMSLAGKQKLKAYGITPPLDEDVSMNVLFGKHGVIECPLCNSKNTEMISQFGSTACKSLFRCLDCKEPFDYFKCH